MFFQGGGTLQFSAVPLNMFGAHKTTADLAVTGFWSERAIKECAKYGTANKVCDTKPDNYFRLPDQTELNEKLSSPEECAYFQYCDNETVSGVEFNYIPDVKVPLFCDMSSNFLSRRFDISKYGLIFAGAHKNCGPSGNTIVIMDEKYLNQEVKTCPIYCSYRDYVNAGGMLNTPATYSIYACGVMFQWMKEQGGLARLEELTDKKARLIYDAIDGSDGFYTSSVQSKNARSRMNVPFRIQGGDEALEQKFLQQAEENKLLTLAGHMSVGGLRASLYNGMPVEGVEALHSFMKSFQSENTQ
jgi:phosphoserine aminotransferase